MGKQYKTCTYKKVEEKLPIISIQNIDAKTIDAFAKKNIEKFGEAFKAILDATDNMEDVEVENFVALLKDFLGMSPPLKCSKVLFKMCFEYLDKNRTDSGVTVNEKTKKDYEQLKAEFEEGKLDESIREDANDIESNRGSVEPAQDTKPNITVNQAHLGGFTCNSPAYVSITLEYGERLEITLPNGEVITYRKKRE